jgi:hypothetical protein
VVAEEQSPVIRTILMGLQTSGYYHLSYPLQDPAEADELLAITVFTLLVSLLAVLRYIPFTIETAVLLATLTHPNHLVQLSSWG